MEVCQSERNTNAEVSSLEAVDIRGNCIVFNVELPLTKPLDLNQSIYQRVRLNVMKQDNGEYALE